MKRILLTSFGKDLCYEFMSDFNKRQDFELFVCDMDERAKARYVTDNFFQVLSADDKQYCRDLLVKAKDNSIQMIIPGSDEEARSLMQEREMFEKEGIIVAVQDKKMLSLFQSKSLLYDYLKEKGFPVPVYKKFRDKNEFNNVLSDFNYPQKTLLIKPNKSRGGRGIILLAESLVPNKDDLVLINKQMFMESLNGTTEYLAMEYIEGTAYDIDVLKYKDGGTYFGIRRRLNNSGKVFYGNIFERNEEILKYCEKLYQTMPTEYLLDYDLMVSDDMCITLLEINPRPSGSTISYLPFGYNLYSILAKSYLENQNVEINNSFQGQRAVTFFKMMKGNG